VLLAKRRAACWRDLAVRVVFLLPADVELILGHDRVDEIALAGALPLAHPVPRDVLQILLLQLGLGVDHLEAGT